MRDDTVFRYLSAEGAPLRESAQFGPGVYAAIWDRDETAEAARGARGRRRGRLSAINAEPRRCFTANGALAPDRRRAEA